MASLVLGARGLEELEDAMITRIATPNCPKCGDVLCGTIERVSGINHIVSDGDGNYDFAGDTELWWEENTTVMDEEGRTLVQCGNAHEWYTLIEENNSDA